MTKYRLTRLPDENGEINFKWERMELNYAHALIDFDWVGIRKEASKLKIGESVIFEENVP